MMTTPRLTEPDNPTPKIPVPMKKTMRIKLEDIVCNAGTQMRVATPKQRAREFAECMIAGDKFPPLKVVYDGKKHYLVDGFKIESAREVMSKWEGVVRQVAAADERDGLSAEEGRSVLSHIRNRAVEFMDIDLLDDLTKLLSIRVPRGFRERVMRDITAQQHGEKLRLDTRGYAFLGGGEFYEDACEFVELVGYSLEECQKNRYLWNRCQCQYHKHPSWAELPDYAGMCLEIYGPANKRINRGEPVSANNA